MLPIWPQQASEFDTLVYAFGATCVHLGVGSLYLAVPLAALSVLPMGPSP